MEIQTSITRLDLIRINFRLWPNIRANWIILAIIWIGTFALGIFQLVDEITLLNVVGFSAAIATVVAPLLSAFSFFVCLIVSISMASERTGLGQHEYQITSVGLRETTRLNDELSKWASFQKVWNFGSYLVLMKHWAAIHIFPKRCFDSPEHMEQFYVLLTERINAA